MDDALLGKLTTGAQSLVKAAADKQQPGHPHLGLYHWLAALMERHAPMAEMMAPGIFVADVTRTARQKLESNDPGPKLDVAAVINDAAAQAQQRGKMQASERDVATIILTRAGYKVAEWGSLQLHGSSSESAEPSGGGEPFKPGSGASATPALDKYGRDLTQMAREGKLSPIIGRHDEIEMTVETLCRRSKRNPVLVGPAGVGKTAIVEGLAQMIVTGKVPQMLKDCRIIAIQPSVLVAGASMSGELEKRVQAVVREASQPGVILFIDEIHTIMGSGGMLGTSDMGSLLKPSLARGDIAVIAATTNDEYRRFIENDAALERRFNPVRVHELSIDETMQVMQTLRDDFVKSRTITISDEILSWLLQFGDQYMRNRHFPDKAVDLLEQCVAHAVTQGKEAVDINDAQEVAQRMVGMPLALEDRLSELEKQLTGQGLLGKAETAALINRLQVTMRGLDMRSDRPNAIIMLTRDAKENSEMLAQVIAQAVYGGEDRVIAIDFARFLHPEDVNLLVGAPPGYIGYTDSLPLHRLAQIPWCVLRFENVDSCHPYIREVLTQTFRDGNLMDGRGKLMHLSDTIVLITADIQIETQRSLGFFQQTAEIGTDDIEAAVRASIGEDLASQLDLVLFGAHGEEGISPEWLEQNLLNEVVQRYSKQGLQIQWDNTLIEWLMEALSQGFSDSDWERWVDNILTPALIQHLPHARAAQKETVTVKIQDGEIAVSKPQ